MDQFQSRANVEVQIFTIDCLRPNLLFNFPIITYLPFYRQPNCVLEFVIVGDKILIRISVSSRGATISRLQPLVDDLGITVLQLSDTYSFDGV